MPENQYNRSATTESLQVWQGKSFLECAKQLRPSGALIVYSRSRTSRKLSGLNYPADNQLDKMSTKHGLIWDGTCWSGRESAVRRLIEAASLKYTHLPTIMEVRSFQDVHAFFINLGALTVFRSGNMQREYAKLLLRFNDVNWLVVGSSAHHINEVTAIISAKTAKKLRVELKAHGARITNCREAYDAHPVSVRVTGWAVSMQFDARDIRHLAFAAPKITRKNRMTVQIPWDWTIITTRKLWPETRKALNDAGIALEGDDPEKIPIRPPVSLDLNKIAGWDTPNAFGLALHGYQRDGIKFAADRGMRAIIGDEIKL